MSLPGRTLVHDITFRRNDQDRRKPRRILTGELMGDPRPDRIEHAEALKARLPQPRPDRDIGNGKAAR
ncbi:MAG: hypothetical protein JWP92_3715 [Caulobacter sp.]|nr:hypothetical protein [Caulobacter sp.]